MKVLGPNHLISFSNSNTKKKIIYKKFKAKFLNVYYNKSYIKYDYKFC